MWSENGKPLYERIHPVKPDKVRDFKNIVIGRIHNKVK